MSWLYKADQLCVHVMFGPRRGNTSISQMRIVALSFSCVRIIKLPSDCIICHQVSSHWGSLNGIGDMNVPAFSLCWTGRLNVHVHTKRDKEKRVRARTQSHSHTSQRLCESQKGEPEGCCVSDVCIVYSVVPVHVGDCCTLRPHSSHVLFTMTGVDSGLLSRRTERPSIKRGEKRRHRSKETERDHWLYRFPLYLFTHCFSFLFSSSLIPSPQTSPWVTSCQTARGGCRLCSYPLFSHFLPFGIHTVLHWRNHVGTPGKWTEATQMLISRWPP